MRLTLLMILVHMLPLAIYSYHDESASASESGHHRNRLRAHRRRHRLKASNHREHDELFDMLGGELSNQVTEKIRRNKTSRPPRERNEPLCASERRSIHLNTHTEEYDPPFIVEVRCRSVHEYEHGLTATLKPQSCVHNLLRCVQRYGEIHVSRRAVGDIHWSPHTLKDMPLGCECMWPVEQYGHQEL